MKWSGKPTGKSRKTGGSSDASQRRIATQIATKTVKTFGKWRDLPSLMTRWATLILSCDEARASVLPDSMLRERSAKGNEHAELPKQCDENESYQRRTEQPLQRSITAEIHPNRNPGVRALTPTRATAMAVPKTAE
ncbi:hypothetical protein RRSWK_02928 [Rhodopirellula sp. SWK7]|nr:hypothetical protein RRSWK_02928 [Rhodopirellula sp. SWK7]